MPCPRRSQQPRSNQPHLQDAVQNPFDLCAYMSFSLCPLNPLACVHSIQSLTCPHALPGASYHHEPVSSYICSDMPYAPYVDADRYRTKGFGPPGHTCHQGTPTNHGTKICLQRIPIPTWGSLLWTLTQTFHTSKSRSSRVLLDLINSSIQQRMVIHFHRQ
jgi:hypothetical protein